MSSPWYPMDAMRQYNKAMRLRWNGWEGTAVLLRAKPGDTPRWVQPVKRKGGATSFEPLPSRRQRTFPGNGTGEIVDVSERWLNDRGWGDQPDCWQPLGAWPDPLPEPLPEGPHHQSRFGTIGGVEYNAVQDYEEMQEARERARRQRDEPEPETPPAWWRDPTAVTYSAPGAIGEREAEGRVMRALYFLGGNAVFRAPRERLNADVLAAWYRAKETAEDLEKPGRFTPRLNVHPTDTADRLLTAMRWACELGAGGMRYTLDGKGKLAASATGEGWSRWVVLDRRARNVPDTWSVIADIVEAPSRQAAQKMYDPAIADIARIANTGTPILDRLLATTQESNRRHADTR